MRHIKQSHVISIGIVGIQLELFIHEHLARIRGNMTAERLLLSHSNCYEQSSTFLSEFIPVFSGLKCIHMGGLRASSRQINGRLLQMLSECGIRTVVLPFHIPDMRFYAASLQEMLGFLTRSSGKEGGNVRLIAPCTDVPADYVYVISQVCVGF